MHPPFWLNVNENVKNHGPFPPKHSLTRIKKFVLKNEGGVDSSSQARSILRSSTSPFAWEQKIVSQTLKTIAANTIIAWHMSEKEQLLHNKEAFGSLDHYRNELNCV